MSKRAGFSEKNAEKDPFVQFERWFGERMATQVKYPEAFTLATASGKGDISARTVLLKSFSNDGFVFFTNYESRKGQQINASGRAAMLFYWPESERQVRIEGSVVEISVEDSYAYFSTRPRISRIGAWASRQSSEIPSRKYLEEEVAAMSAKFRGSKIPLPPHWGGYRIIPDRFEFWQEGEYRLHDRICYSLVKSSWKMSRLSP